MIYLIYETQYDPLTSLREPDEIEVLLGYVDSEQEAKDLVEESGDFRPYPEYREKRKRCYYRSCPRLNAGGRGR